MTEQVRLGIVGLGWWGRVLADAVGRCGSAEIVSCFARTSETRETFASDYGCRGADSLDGLLAEDGVEGVLYATPHTLHLTHIEAAAAAGVHAFVEKPLALNTEDARAAIAAVDEAGVQLMVGHQRRRQTANRKLRARVDDGSFGQLVHAEASFIVSKGYPQTWRSGRGETPLGGMTALGVHSLDTFHYLVGDIARVSAFSNSVVEGEPLDHATGLLLEFASGAVATLITSHYGPAANRIAIYGTGGAGFNEDDGRHLFVQERTDPVRSEVEVAVNDPIAEQIDEFAGAIRGTTSIETGGAEGLAVVTVLDAAVASVERRAAVEVAEFRN